MTDFTMRHRRKGLVVLPQRRRPFLAHLYGPAARCKPKMIDLEKLVLRFCIRPIDGAFKLLAIMDIRARSISFASRPPKARWAT